GLLDALQLVARAAEGAARRVAKRTDRSGALLAGVDELLGEGAEDAVAPRVDLADLLAVLARRFDHAGRAGVDHRRDAPRLRIKRISCHDLFALCSLRFSSIREQKKWHHELVRRISCRRRGGTSARAGRHPAPTCGSTRP